MALFLTEKNVCSKPFIKRMFKCIIPGSINPNDQNWTAATYISKELKNGFNATIIDSECLIWMITPFVKYLFQRTFYQDRITRDYALRFSIQIRTENEFVWVGEFYFRSNRNPFRPVIEGLEFNQDLSPYLEHPYKILVETNFFYINGEESVLPKPLKKTFKHDQCVICLDRKPNVLFVKCRHTCVCNECEEAHPSIKCPCCRMEISEKLLI